MDKKKITKIGNTIPPSVKAINAMVSSNKHTTNRQLFLWRKILQILLLRKKKQKIKAICMENKETRSQPPPLKAMPPINNPTPNRNGK